MALEYLKIEPEEAVRLLDDCIVKGYQAKDNIDSNYFKNKSTITDELINQWNEVAKKWISDTLIELSIIFVSLKYSYNFRDAEISPLIRTGENRIWDRINKLLAGKIRILNQYDSEIKTHFNIKVEIVGRDKVVQSGNESKLEIKN